MNLTDQERLHKCVVNDKLEDVVFSQPDKNCESYFESVDVQPVLSVYNLENINDIRNMMNGILAGDGFNETRSECMRITLENIILYEQNSKIETKGSKRIDVPEFIYNF